MSKYIAWQFWYDEKGTTLEESNISTLRKMMESFIAGYEAAQHSVQLTGATCPTHNEPVSDLIHYECGCSTTRPRN